jgi:UDP-N-acetylglucosamine 2-epimerase (non-hydrolysing)
MRKLRVMTVVGTRPEIIRLSRIIALLDKYCDHKLVHTGQNFDYELNEIFFSELRIRQPDVYLSAAGSSAAETIGNVIIKADTVISQHEPEAILLLGDTNSCLAAIAAKRRKIPIFHMEAGNRCFDFRVPEEINRRIVDHVSDINLTYSDIAREYLLREGFPPDQVIKTGSPLREVLEYYEAQILASDILERLDLQSRRFFVVSAHREENVDSVIELRRLVSMLNALSEQFGEPIVFSTHPRTRQRLEAAEYQVHSNVRFHKPFGFIDYVKLQTESRCVLSDSGTITEESSILNFPALNIRNVHERPEGFEEGAVMLVGLDQERVFQALSILESQPRGQDRGLRMVPDYVADNVSEKVLRIIHSYTSFVNLKTWQRVGIPSEGFSC